MHSLDFLFLAQSDRDNIHQVVLLLLIMVSDRGQRLKQERTRDDVNSGIDLGDLSLFAGRILFLNDAGDRSLGIA